MGGRADRHDEDHDQPQRARVDRAERAELPVRHQGKHQQRGRGQYQQVVQFLRGQHAAHEMMHRLARRQQDRHRHRQPGGQRRLVDGHRAQQQAQQQAGLGGQAAVAAGIARIGDRQQRRHRGQCQQQHRDAEARTDRPQQRHHGERADAGNRIAVATLAPLALGADQQSDAQRDREAGPGKNDIHQATPMTRHGRIPATARSCRSPRGKSRGCDHRRIPCPNGRRPGDARDGAAGIACRQMSKR